MTNFEPKKLPPLGPPGRKLPTPPPAKPAPAVPPPAPAAPPASNLPPKIGGLPVPPRMPTAPVTPVAPLAPQPSLPTPQSAPPAPQIPTQPAFPQQAPTQYPQTQQPYEEQYSAPPEPTQEPEQTWEEKYRDLAKTDNDSSGDSEASGAWGEKPRSIKRTNNESEEEPEEEAPVKGRRGAKKPVASKKPVQAKKAKPSKKEKSDKPDPYAGARKKLLMTRIAIFGTLGILVIAGVYSFIPRASYLTAADQNAIIVKVRENLGETYFPSEAGEGWARGFLDVYLNYTPEIADERKAQLLTYTTEEVLKDIDITFLTIEEVDRLANKEKATIEDLSAATGIYDSKVQIVTAGPYLIKQELLPGDNTGIFSYKVQINGNNWAYIEVPVYYNMEQRGLSISGTPTFRSVIPISTPPAGNREVKFENDREVADRIKDDITAYMEAWVSSDQTGIDRYLVKEGGANAVTPQASTGLGGSVDFLGVDKMTVELKPMPAADEMTAEARANFNERFVVVSIRVIEPTSGIVYRQNYQLTIQYVNENWFVQDIRSMVAFADNSEGTKS